MGRELALQLAAAGCHIAICDLTKERMEDTVAGCRRIDGVRVSSHACDVSSETALEGFREEVKATHETEAINLLFNNAGIGGGGSFIEDDRADWERTFGVCWYGVYYGARVFMPMLLAAKDAHIVNTSSINGFWASLGPGVSHTAYCAAKFAVKGFSEALVTDLRLTAPHVKVSVVMPGHIGTDIAGNTGQVLGKPSPDELSSEELAVMRARMVARGLPVDNQPDEFIRAAIKKRINDFRENAPTSAADAATIILDGVREERWRILVGDDAHAIDALVREDPAGAYEENFVERLAQAGHLTGLVPPSRTS